MLKDVTLGQFFPGKSLIHRLDPRTKLLILVGYIVALFLAVSWLSYGVVFAFLAVCIAISRIPVKSFFKGMKPLIFILVFTGVLNIFFTPGETKLVSIALTDGLESLLSPLKKIKLPVHELSMMMCIALRFIPTLIEETDKIMSAQKARGADFESGKLMQRVKALVPILVPLFISAFRRADELATAMECRCYQGGEGRTKMKLLRMHGFDYCSFLVAAVMIAGVCVLRSFGL